MDVTSGYFEFKRKYMLKYCTTLMGSTKYDEVRDEYLLKYIDTYINSYYYGILDTLDYNKVTEIDYAEICEELKGRCIEMQYELGEDEKLRLKPFYKDYQDLILSTYTYALFSIILDLKDFTSCNMVIDYETIVRKVFEKNKKLVIANESKIKEIIKQVKKNTTRTREYLNTLENGEFFLAFDEFRGQENKYIARMHYNIPRLTNTYKKMVIDRMYNEKAVFKNKFKHKLNLINAMILNKLINNEILDYYFVNLPINYIESKKEMNEYLSLIDNPVCNKYIVFMVDYKLYKNKKTIIRCLKNNKLALIIDLKRVKDINVKLEELESYNDVNYYIIEDLRTEDAKLVLNYEMDGKEIFQNRYEFKS